MPDPSAGHRNIAILGYEGNTALDLVGGAGAFFVASYLPSPPAYRVITTSLDGSSFRSEAGFHVTPECSLDEIDPIDTLIVPGGAGLREPAVAEAIVQWICHNHHRVRRV